MNTEKPNQTDRVRDEATIAKLRELGQKLFSGDINKARLAAHQLSWMQEDGFTILKMALLGNYSRDTKKAAAYGLRSMKGRMKKLAIELLQEGLKDSDLQTHAASKKALQLMKILPPEPARPGKPKRPNRPGQQGQQRSGQRPPQRPGGRIQNLPPEQRPKRPYPQDRPNRY